MKRTSKRKTRGKLKKALAKRFKRKALKGIALGLVEKIPYVGTNISRGIERQTEKGTNWLEVALLIIAVLGFLFAVFKVVTVEELDKILDLFF